MSLRQRLVKLASEKPELRQHLLPLLRQASIQPTSTPKDLWKLYFDWACQSIWGRGDSQFALGIYRFTPSDPYDGDPDGGDTEVAFREVTIQVAQQSVFCTLRDGDNRVVAQFKLSEHKVMNMPAREFSRQLRSGLKL